MLTLEPERVTWLYDPTGGFNHYDEKAIVEFLDFIRDTDINTFPSGRYHMLRERIHFWGAHKFFFGVATEDEAQYLVATIGGYCMPGVVADGRFRPNP